MYVWIPARMRVNSTNCTVLSNNLHIYIYMFEEILSKLAT